CTRRNGVGETGSSGLSDRRPDSHPLVHATHHAVPAAPMRPTAAHHDRDTPSSTPCRVRRSSSASLPEFSWRILFPWSSSQALRRSQESSLECPRISATYALPSSLAIS